MSSPAMCNPHPMFFCHIPKTAGGAVSRYLGGRFTRDQILEFEGAAELFDITDQEIATHSCILGHAGATFARRIPEHFVRVTLLREPRKRILSLYNFFKELGALPSETTFQQFVENPGNSAQINNLQAWQLFRDFDLTIRRHHINTPKKEILKGALDNLSQFDLIGVDTDLPKFTERLGVVLDMKRPIELPHVNVSKKIKASFTPEDLELLKPICDLDDEVYEQAKILSQNCWGRFLTEKKRK